MNVPMEKEIRHHVEYHTIDLYSFGIAGSIAGVVMAREKFP